VGCGAEHAFATLQVTAPHELGTPLSAVSGLFGAPYPVYVRGQAYLAANKATEAASEFRKILDHCGIVVSDPVAALSHLAPWACRFEKEMAVRNKQTKVACSRKVGILIHDG
jgi:hypothetical protein